jgi:hypothetical protein
MSFATLAFFGSRRLLEQFFDLPVYVARVMSGLRDQSLIWAIGNDPVNVAVCGNYLE